MRKLKQQNLVRAYIQEKSVAKGYEPTFSLSVFQHSQEDYKKALYTWSRLTA